MAPNRRLAAAVNASGNGGDRMAGRRAGDMEPLSASDPGEVAGHRLIEVVVPLTVRDLAAADLPACAWSGSASHIRSIAAALERAERGEVDYLAVCPPSGLPVALGGVDYARSPGAGTLWQLAVHGALQSCGIGTILIGAAEQRIRARGLHQAELAVEENNPRARGLYERLGYAAYGSALEAWDEDEPGGSVRRYESVVTLMRKVLP
jgi:ribosomal protein S18 acetylase RimI-like enzyme